MLRLAIQMLLRSALYDLRKRIRNIRVDETIRELFLKNIKNSGGALFFDEVEGYILAKRYAIGVTLKVMLKPPRLHN